MVEGVDRPKSVCTVVVSVHRQPRIVHVCDLPGAVDTDVSECRLMDQGLETGRGFLQLCTRGPALPDPSAADATGWRPRMTFADAVPPGTQLPHPPQEAHP